MANDIKVTPNILKCIDIFKQAVAELPDSEFKEMASNAVKYLEMTAAGEPQIMDDGCPPDRIFFPG